MGKEKKLIDDAKGEIWRNAPNRCVLLIPPINFTVIACRTAEADGVTPRKLVGLTLRGPIVSLLRHDSKANRRLRLRDVGGARQMLTLETI